MGAVVKLHWGGISTGLGVSKFGRGQKLAVLRLAGAVNLINPNSRCTKRQVMRVEKFYVAKPHILYIIKKV